MFSCVNVAGHDDAIALMLACTHPSLQVLGVSTVACNQSVDKTTINALAVLHAIGHQDVKVHRGQAKPLVQGNVHCAAIHGDSGLDGLAGGRIFPESPHGPHPEKAVIAIAEQIRSLETDGRLPLQLICTGSLTNAALLLTVFPEFSSEKYINITLMGGALGTGNTGDFSPSTGRVMLQLHLAFPAESNFLISAHCFDFNVTCGSSMLHI